MKKTLITLLSLAGVAMATNGYDYYWSGNLSWGSDETPLTFAWDEDIAQSPISITELTSDQNYKSTKGDAFVGTYTPDVNIGSSTTNSWTLNFTITNTSAEQVTIYDIELGTFLFNGGGDPQSNDDFSRPVSFTLAAGDNVLATVTNPYANCGNDWKNSTLISLGDKRITLAADEAVTLKVTAQSAQTANNYGTFVGVSSMAVYVPEPATATLSLLALAGLAARRRRK